MSVNSVQNAPDFDPSLYNSLMETAKAKNVSSSRADLALLNAINTGKDFQTAVAQVKADLPTLPPPLTTTLTSLGEWVGMPSPAALFASVIVKDAAEQRVQNRETIRAQGEEIVGLMEEQADKIEKGAMQKFACAVAGAAVSMAAGAVSLGIAMAGVKVDEAGKLHMKSGTGAIDSQVTSGVAQSFNTMISSVGTIINAGGDYAQSIQQAETKRLEAKQEQIRTYQELTKQTNEAMRDLIAKSLDFMNSMQANQNQTRTKILG